jgi:hypothetical protein
MIQKVLLDQYIRIINVFVVIRSKKSNQRKL